MPLETGTYISDLDAANPDGDTDKVKEGDNHIRLVKSTILASFPNITGAMTASHTELNVLDGVTVGTAELNALAGATALILDIASPGAIGATTPGDATFAALIASTLATTGNITAGNDIILAGSATFESGEGCVFDGNAISAATTLDDYKVTSFTPVLTDGVNPATLAAASGKCIKIGDAVFFRLKVSASSLASMSGDIRITGLPYSTGSLAGNASCGSAYGLNIAAGSVVGGYMGVANAHIHLTLWDDAAGVSNMQASEWSDNGQAFIFGTYFV